ncbi:helix-turn-helix transcriptional regulator [Thalassobacillus devorans]|uniref:helix-turn-helix transcriptional regulator n=1 Tax=Thalassobacillus devorans TaxID=279813 RepID=UPI000A1CDEB8|nr:helix-turn-helix domain-containing protein [Thalassobacillus devorans]
MENETVKLIRYYLRMSQPDFAEHIGVTYSTVAEVEAGRRKVTDGLCAKIALKFDPTDEGFQAFVKRNRELKAVLKRKN